MGKIWWNQGIMTEVLNEIIRFFFEDIGVNRIFGRHPTANIGSGRVMQKSGMQLEGIARQAKMQRGNIYDLASYSILAEDYFNPKPESINNPNIETIKTLTELMFYNLRIAIDTSDWNADICGASAWRYIYHTIHSADKFFINPSKRFEEPEPPFHTSGLDWVDAPSDKILDRDTLYDYYGQVRNKVIDYLNTLSDIQLSEIPEGCGSSRLSLIMGQFRHMYAHIGILNGVTIANTGQYPRVVNSSDWRSGKLPDGLYDNDV